MVQPVAIAISMAACLALLWQWPGAVGSIAILLSLVAGPVAALAILVVVAIFWFRRRRRKALSVLLVLLAPAALWPLLSWAADYVHLGLTAGFGVAEIGAGRQLGEQGPIVHDWTVEMDGGPKTFLIFDSTYSIAKPIAAEQAPDSGDRIEQACSGKARHLLSHYYVCSL